MYIIIKHAGSIIPLKSKLYYDEKEANLYRFPGFGITPVFL
jgi:hypothetical protein